MPQDKIRNFSIIAHIDHGKSTLADRILEQTQAVALRNMEDQLLDNMDLERERGITIKAHAVTLVYRAKDGEDYVFNLIDTPGHVDFNYEVSRSLAACEGAVLVVDASQGMSPEDHALLARIKEQKLPRLVVMNQCDRLPENAPRPAMEGEETLWVSAATGENIHQLKEAIARLKPDVAREHHIVADLLSSGGQSCAGHSH